MMKFFFLLIATALCSVSHVAAQSSTVSDTFQLGTRKVRVPAPEGFVDTSREFERVALRLRTTEDPRNENLASYIPDWLVPKLEANQNIELPLYAKFTVGRLAKTVDCPAECFAREVAGAKADLPKVMDADSKLAKQVQTNMDRALEELWGKGNSASVSEQRILGYFQDTDSAFSSLVAMNLQINGKTMPMIVGGSMVRVNQRLIYLYVFQVSSSKDDLKPMMDRTKKWTAAILAANNGH